MAERLSLIGRATDDAFYDWNLRSGTVWSNEAYRRQFGDHALDVATDMQDWMGRIHPDERDRVQASLQTALAGTADIWSAEYQYARTDGRYAYVLDRLSIVRDATGQPIRMAGAMLDLTERRRTEVALRASEEKFAKVFGLSPIMLTLTSLTDGRLLDVNQSLLNMTGYTREEVLGRTPVELGWWVHPEEREHGLTILRQRGQIRDISAQFRMRNGDVRTCLYSVEIIEINGQPCVLTTLVDITERQQVEAALRENQQVLSLVMRGGRIGAWWRDPVTNEVWWSRDLEELFGLEPGGFGGTEAKFYEFVHADDHPAIAQAVESAIIHHTDYVVEFRFRRADGSRGWMEGRGRATYDAAGQVQRLYGIGIDITERKEAEEALRLTSARQAFLLKLGDALRPLADPLDIQGEAARVLGEHLGASRVQYGEVEAGGEYVTVWRDYTDGVLGLVGQLRLDDFGSAVINTLRAGRTLVMNDVNNSADVSAAERAAYATVQIGAQIGVSLVKNGRLAAIFAVHQRTPRQWTPAEIELVEETAERTWTSIERARTELDLRESKHELQLLNQTLETRIIDRTAELRESQSQLRKLSAYVERMRENERARIAREVHDELGGSLTALKMTLSRVRRGRDQDTDLINRLNDMRSQIDHLVQTVRRIASDLRPPLLDDFGLIAALKWQAGEWEKRTGIMCQLNLPEQEVQLDAERRTAVFRVFQESLTNVARHAQATQVVTSVSEDAEQFTLIVRDNGRGIDAEALRPGKSLGLLGIRERMRDVSGNVEISGTPGQGTTVVIRVPIVPANTDGTSR